MKTSVARFVVAMDAAAIGVALAVYAEADDSPGGVLLGILLVVGAVVIAVKAALRKNEGS